MNIKEVFLLFLMGKAFSGICRKEAECKLIQQKKTVTSFPWKQIRSQVCLKWFTNSLKGMFTVVVEDFLPDKYER